MQKIIENKLQKEFDPIFLQVINESKFHRRGENSHFKIVLVSEFFAYQNKISRHRSVHQCLENELKQVHSLSLHLFTLNEWNNEKIPASPKCVAKI